MLDLLVALIHNVEKFSIAFTKLSTCTISPPLTNWITSVVGKGDRFHTAGFTH